MGDFVCEGAQSRVKNTVPSLSRSLFSAFLLLLGFCVKAPREPDRGNPHELQSCLNGQVAEIRPSLPAIQGCTFLHSHSAVGQKSQPLTLKKTTQKWHHYQLHWLYQKEYFSTMRTMMKALLTPLETSYYNYSMFCFCHMEGDCRWSSSALGWNEMHSVLLQEMWHGTGSQELLRCSSLPDGNFCDVGQDVLSIPGLSFSKGD